MVKCSNSGTIPYVSSPRELIFVSLPKEKNSADQLEGDGGLSQCLLSSWKGIIDFGAFCLSPSFCRIFLKSHVCIALVPLLQIPCYTSCWKNRPKYNILQKRELLTTLLKNCASCKKSLVPEVTTIPWITLVKLEWRFCNFLSKICSWLEAKSEHS